MNAAVIAGIVALKAGFYNRLFDVVLGTLLKDLGMMRVPAEILHSSEKLRPEEWEKIKQHPLHSLKLVEGVPGLSAYAKVAILHHHERLDGSGYPQGVSGRNLNPLAQIAGMADAFSAMICQRPYRDKMLPHEAVEYLMGSGGFEFELELVQTFCQVVVPYPLGSMVQLNTGEKGVVVRLNSVLSRPVVRVFFDGAGKEVRPVYDIDLAAPDQQTRVITGILDI